MAPLRIVIVAISLFLIAGNARAQSAATCSFDQGTATVTVTVNGTLARLAAAATTNEIRVDGVPCGGATVDNTDTIQVNGGALSDSVILSGRFGPGLTIEAGQASEIEIAFALAGGTDLVRINASNGNDRITFTSGGIDVENDLDEDVHLAGVERIELHALDGDDRVDASGWTPQNRLFLYGGDGNDRLTGSGGDNEMFGQTGDDVLYGNAGDDGLDGGSGNDVLYGGDGADRFRAGWLADGSDVVSGGAGVDTVYYSQRAAGVTVTLGNGLADDGEAGEADEIRATVEAVYGSSGDDVLVGTTAANSLNGGPGIDELYGGAGVDSLVGAEGDDSLFGEAGADDLYGGEGNDVLDGGANLDRYFGAGGDDLFFNADGVGETIDCGAGAADDAEPEASDIFLGCEL